MKAGIYYGRTGKVKFGAWGGMVINVYGLERKFETRDFVKSWCDLEEAYTGKRREDFTAPEDVLRTFVLDEVGVVERIKQGYYKVVSFYDSKKAGLFSKYYSGVKDPNRGRNRARLRFERKLEKMVECEAARFGYWVENLSLNLKVVK